MPTAAVSDSSPSDATAEAWGVAGRFRLPGPVTAVTPLGNGNVNETFLVRVDAPGSPGFVLQRLNTQAFRQPRLVMGNHLKQTGEGCSGPGSGGMIWNGP